MVDVKKPLYRIPESEQIAGVCAGLAEYFDMDVTLVRVLFVVAVFVTGGAAILLYIILAIVLPVKGAKGKKSAESSESSQLEEKVEQLGKELSSNKSLPRVRNYLGAGIMVFGLWLLLNELFPKWAMFKWEIVWPVILIIIGVLIIIRKSSDEK